MTPWQQFFVSYDIDQKEKLSKRNLIDKLLLHKIETTLISIKNFAQNYTVLCVFGYHIRFIVKKINYYLYKNSYEEVLFFISNMFRCARGVANMCIGNYQVAAESFLQCTIDNCDFPEVLILISFQTDIKKKTLKLIYRRLLVS